MEARLPAILADTEELVKCESPSADLEAVARSADIVADVGARHLGSVAERIVIDGRTHLRWRLGEGPAGCCCCATTTRCGRWGRSRRIRTRCPTA